MDPIELLENDLKRRKALEVINNEAPITTYGLGNALDITAASVENRVEPLRELGLIKTEWREERNIKKRCYMITKKGKHTLKEYYDREIDKLKHARAALGSFKDL